MFENKICDYIDFCVFGIILLLKYRVKFIFREYVKIIFCLLLFRNCYNLFILVFRSR